MTKHRRQYSSSERFDMLTVSERHIVRIVAHYYHVKPRQILAIGRHEYHEPRQVVMHYFHQRLGLSYKAISEAFGYGDASSSAEACRAYGQHPSEDEAFWRRLKYIEADLERQEQERVVEPIGPRVVTAVERHFELAPGSLVGVRRHARVARPRQVAMYLCRAASMTFPRIGDLLRRHHSTAMFGCRKVESLIASDAALALIVETLMTELAIPTPSVPS